MARNYQEEFNELAGIFSAGWGEETPVAWPNVSYMPEQGVSWVRFNVLTGESEQASIGAPGSNYFRYTGVIDIQVFVPTDAGEPAALALADKALEIFHNARASGFMFSAGYVAGGGNASGLIVQNSSSSRGWMQKNVRIPYRRDSFK